MKGKSISAGVENVFNNAKNFDAHVQRKHPPWMCGGAVWVEKKKGKGEWVPCKEVCAARSSLWSHFRRKHEGRYHHYCRINNCKHGSDEEWAVHLHRFNKHNIPLRSQQKCPKCGHPFGQERRYRNHVLTCRTNERPFVCKVCGEDFRQQDTYSRITCDNSTRRRVCQRTASGSSASCVTNGSLLPPPRSSTKASHTTQRGTS